MTREVEPCPFYQMPCEYVPFAHRTEQAAAEERAKIVAWLRENSTLTGYHWGVSIIDAIKAGEHLKQCP